MRLLTVPNWSFGREKTLLRKFRETLDRDGIDLHYCESDVDYNRTITAYSGDSELISEVLLELCDLAFSKIDLNKHTGVHPRIGALDVCPFVMLKENPSESELQYALAVAERAASALAARFELPVFLYEKSERGRHEADLPSLRHGGFGGLQDRDIRPDFGPAHAHPRLGVTVLGVRDFLITVNVDLATEALQISKHIANTIRDLRTEGDPRFLGVRAMAFPLASVQLTQVSLTLTLPDLTPIDPIVEWVAKQAISNGVAVVGTDLVGVIREKDLPTAERLQVRPAQIIETVKG